MPVGGPLHVFLVAGEPSGDALGAKLIRALRQRRWNLQISGVGGEAMAGEGLHSLFPMADIAVMGFVPVLKRLPTLIDRIRRTQRAVIEARPDVLVIIDSPDFTHRVARKVRAMRPDLPILNYVSPTVWAWRPGRAARMRAYIDHVLAVLPFEPEAHQRLGGPACSYVGHPLIERFNELRPRPEDALQREFGRNVLILPGSRLSEVSRLMPVFGEAVARVAAEVPKAAFFLPAVAHVADAVRSALRDWPVKPEIVIGEQAKWMAFRRARAALAASGTVTLELGLAQVPMVTAYKVSAIEKQIIRALVTVSTPILPSLILGEPVVPELLQEQATGAALAEALIPLVTGGEARSAQLAAFDRLDAAMQVTGGNPSAAAAEIVLYYGENGRRV
ncbi:MAG TPA: lipid-A-disaccharide synthase [Beijerinckiaceae bacterium]|nr:lipid-A-disaccharide synthase [Beijerinckiaceae bacterium]